MTRTLHLAKDLTLPLDAVTQTFAIFGKRGSGKSNSATVLVEELLAAGLPVVVLDPVDAWFGLKSSFDGKQAGYPIYIFGGAHGDLPLEPSAGALIADVVVNERLPLVLSMKLWSGGERARFVTDFAKRLLQTNTQPLMVVCEEADAFIPQRPMKGEEAMLGAMDRLVRWGRQSGIGCTIVTQRSAKVNKDVTTQAETLIAFRTTGPQDREAIDAWIKYHAGDEARQEVLATLPTLPNGTAWVWSPEWLGILKQVAFRRRSTFDSAATPKVGQKVTQPKTLAAVDLERLRTQMAATVEKAKADDPRELRKQIAELKKQLTVKSSAVAEKVTSRVVEKPLLTDADRSLLAELAKVVRETREAFEGESALAFATLQVKAEAEIAHAFQRLRDELGRVVVSRHKEFAERFEKTRIQKILDKLATVTPASTSGQPTKKGLGDRVATRAATPRPVAQAADSDNAVSPARQKVVNGLAFLHGIGIPAVDKTQLALIVGVSPISSGYSNNLGALRSAGLIDYPSGGIVALTAAGEAIASTDGIPSTTRQLHDAIRAKLPPAKWKILEALIKVYPASLSKDALAERIEVSPTSSGFSNNLGSLRSLGLIDYPRPSEVAARPVLFLE